jgi:hypothetical protein
MGRTKPVVSKDYVVGITDGEGCFYVNVSKLKTYKTGYRIQLHFHLKLQEMDKELLESIKNTLRCGNVYFQKDARPNHTHCYRYTVGSTKEVIEIIIPFFKKNQLQTASKRKNFDIFCQIAELIINNEHLGPAGVKKILTLKSQMNQKTTGLA